MKRIAYSFLLIFLLSCGSNSDLKNDRIRIQFRDTIPHEYYLLSVRDSTIVVAPGYFDAAGPQSIVPFSRINKIYHSSDERSLKMLAGGILGFSAVIAAGMISGGSKGLSEGYALGVAALSIPGFLTGMAIGCAASHDEKGFDLYDQIDLYSIKQFARYPNGEPPELQKIK